jgi:uncharacterized membrane protein YhaH (DUF805 family)
MKWYLQVLRKYALFNGRARRKEYWMFFLFNTVILIILQILDIVNGKFVFGSDYGLFYTIYGLAIFIPYLAVSIRRMHDSGESGWVLLIPVYNLIVACTKGDIGDNIYGSDPKESENKANEHLRKEITIKNKKSQISEQVTIGYWEKIKKTYGEDAFEIIEYHEKQ